MLVVTLKETDGNQDVENLRRLTEEAGEDVEVDDDHVGVVVVLAGVADVAAVEVVEGDDEDDDFEEVDKVEVLVVLMMPTLILS